MRREMSHQARRCRRGTMKSWVVNFVLLLLCLVPRRAAEASTASPSARRNSSRDFFEKTLLQLMYQRRMFMDGFYNGTATVQTGLKFLDGPSLQGEGEGRGRRKRLRQMNRTLIAIVMAYTLKFIFLIPTFMGTLILLKFTTGLAGFFYALFAAILGLDRHQH